MANLSKSIKILNFNFDFAKGRRAFSEFLKNLFPHKCILSSEFSLITAGRWVGVEPLGNFEKSENYPYSFLDEQIEHEPLK